LDLLTALHDSAPVALLRGGRWSYAAVNAAHILGFALLIGAIAPLDLRLIGWRREVPLASLARTLLPVAIGGLVLAMVAGFLLFAVRAPDYADKPLFWVKMALVACGIANAVLLHHAVAWDIVRRGDEAAREARLRLAGLLSITLWVAVLICGRMLAFVD
jgi:hypothetical protein